jgi:protein-S-isoprenylcysteine O-methyltransferase Ste14
MSTDWTARPNALPWPPMIFAAAAVLALLLDRVVPLPGWLVLRGVPGVAWLGWGLVGAALALDVWAMATMWRARANILPHRAASALVTHGPFGFSRNPIYLGNTVLLVGLGVGLGNAWFVPAALGAAVVVTQMAILREESHLNARFGAAWREYRMRVNRWVGRSTGGRRRA